MGTSLVFGVVEIGESAELSRKLESCPLHYIPTMGSKCCPLLCTTLSKGIHDLGHPYLERQVGIALGPGPATFCQINKAN